MGGTLTFKVDDTLKKIVAHTMAAKEWKEAYTGKKLKKPSLFFVKDRGAYIMSAATKTLLKGKDKGHVVSFANGLDPDKNEDVWDQCREICGGDDFAENLDCDDFDKIIKEGAKTIRIVLTDTSIAIKYDKVVKVAPKSPFADLQVGDEVVRVLANSYRMRLKITAVTETTLACGDWIFDKKTGAEIDDQLEWGPAYGKSGSYLDQKEQTALNLVKKLGDPNKN